MKFDESKIAWTLKSVYFTLTKQQQQQQNIHISKRSKE